MYIPENVLAQALKAAAEVVVREMKVPGNTEEERFDMAMAMMKRSIYESQQEVYDRQDVIQWFEDQGYDYGDDDVDQILCTLRDDWDADRGTWSNIESAYYNNDMHLPYVDDEPEESEEAAACQASFPRCQKCAHIEECEAYQHALSSLDDAAQMGIPEVFKHDTDDCESFEPDCEACNSHCPLHADCPVAMQRVEESED